MYRYSLAQCQISSSVALAGLAHSTGPARPGDLKIEFAEMPSVAIPIVDWRHHWRSGVHSPSLSLAAFGDGWLLRVPHLADFLIAGDLTSIRVQPLKAMDAGTMEHLVLDQVLPRILGQRGEIMLHASAVELKDNGVVLFIGASGQGKSTWAATLHQMGHRVLSDDCVLLRPIGNSVTALATYPSLRLMPDSVDHFSSDVADLLPMADYSSKRRMPLPPIVKEQTGLDVTAMFLLQEPAGEGEIKPVSPRQAFIELARNTFRLDATDATLAAGLVPGIALVAERVPAFALRSPSGLSALREFAESVLIAENMQGAAR